MWNDNFENKTIPITAELWGNSTIEECHNGNNWAIVMKPDDAFYNNTYSKVVWTEMDQNSSFYYCEIAYNMTSSKNASEWTIDKV